MLQCRVSRYSPENWGTVEMALVFSGNTYSIRIAKRADASGFAILISKAALLPHQNLLSISKPFPFIVLYCLSYIRVV
jgi:hypothetical protein